MVNGSVLGFRFIKVKDDYIKKDGLNGVIYDDNYRMNGGDDGVTFGNIIHISGTEAEYDTFITFKQIGLY